MSREWVARLPDVASPSGAAAAAYWRCASSDDLAVEAALARGSDFCQRFVEATTRGIRGVEGDGGWSVDWIARFALPIVEAGAAPLPDSPAFGRSWAAMLAGPRTGELSLVDEMRDLPRLIEGRAAVAEFFDGSASAALRVLVDGHPGAALFHLGTARVAFDFRVEAGQVVSITFRAAPDVLEGMVPRRDADPRPGRG